MGVGSAGGERGARSVRDRGQLESREVFSDGVHVDVAGGDPVDPEEGATTVEYAIGTIAAAGFAGLLIVILKSDAVRAALESIIQEALNTR